MKKALVIMAALVVIASLAFADVSISTWGRIAYDVASSSTAPNAAIVSGFNAGGLGWPNEPTQSLQFVWSTDKLAFNMKFNTDNTKSIADLSGAIPTGAASPVYIAMVDLYGTIKAVPDLATVMIGKFGSGYDAFRKATAHDRHGMNQGDLGRFDGYGIIASIAPKDSNFETAVMWEANNPVAAAGNEIVPPVPARALQDLQGTALNTSIGVSYTLPSLVKLTAGSNVQGAIYPAQTTRNIYVRATLLAVTNLDAFVAFKYTGLEKDVNPSIIDILVGANYKMDALQGILGVDITNTTPVGGGTSVLAWEAQPEVAYTLGPVTLGVWGSVSSNSAANAPIAFGVEPYVKINDFATRIAVNVNGSTASGTYINWSIPVTVDFGF